MKAVFLSYNQALTDRVHAILDEQGIRGFTKWALTQGRGSVDGEPHYGTHAWPSMNASILAIIDDEQLEPLMTALRELDASTRMQGSRAFYWTVEGGFGALLPPPFRGPLCRQEKTPVRFGVRGSFRVVGAVIFPFES